MSARSVLIAAGGTGGHVIPALAVAEELAARGVPVEWVGTARGLESRLVPRAGIALHRIDIEGLRGSGVRGTLAAPYRLARALAQSLALLARLKPRAVLGMGGFVSGPVGLAALVRRVPLVLHEQNAVAGLTNAKLARFSTRVFSAFPDVFPARIGAETVGNPVRRDMTAELPVASPPMSSDIDASERPPLSLLVIGGSRGAEALNRGVPVALARLRALGQPVAVRHQAGAGRGDATRARYADDDDAVVEDFIDDMRSAYLDADLVISRAGAMTVTELGALGRPALLVPYPHAVDDHQSVNARHLADAGAAILVPQSGVDDVDGTDDLGGRLADEISRLNADRPALARMANAARTRFRAGAAERVADALIEASGGLVEQGERPVPGGDEFDAHGRRPGDTRRVRVEAS